MNLKRIITLLALTASLTSTHAGIHHWSGGGNNELWSNPANWIEGAPTAGEAAPVELVFPIATAKNLTNNIPGLTVDTLRLFGSGVTLRGSGGGSLTLRGGQATTVYCRGVNSIAASLPVTLQSTSVIEIEGGTNVLTLSSVISGTGGLTKTGLGALVFASVNNNTYTGTTRVLRGPLRLANASIGGSRIAVPGPLVIGENNPTNSPNVRLLAHHQIANTSPVTINENGTLYLDGFDDTIGALTMTGGTIYTDDGADIGTLTLNGDVTYHHTPTIVGGIAGHLSLGDSTRTFNIVSGTLTLDAIEGGPAADLIKTGAGQLGLTGATTYQGHTIVNGGFLQVRHPQALGSFATDAAGTTVNYPGAVSLHNNAVVTGEQLFLNDLGELVMTGSSAWNGNVTVTGAPEVNAFNGASSTIEGVIGGTGALIKTGLGALRLAGPTANHHTGGTFIRHGTLQLAKFANVTALPGPVTIGDGLGGVDADQVVLMSHNQIPNDAAITIHDSGLLDLNGFVETIGPLTLIGGHLDSSGIGMGLAGDVTTVATNVSAVIDGRFFLAGSGIFDTQPGNVTPSLWIRAQILGNTNQPLVKRGIGTLRLSHTNNLYDGLTLVQQGSLWLTKSAPGSTASGTVVSNRATLTLSHNTTVGNEPLALPGTGAGNTRAALVSFFGTNWWGGPISLVSHAAILVQDPSDWFTVHGAITGNYSLTKTGPGILEFSGDVPNTYSGNTAVYGGVLALDKVPGAAAIPNALTIGYPGTNTAEVRLLGANQIHDLSAVSILTNSLLNLNNQLETIGSLAGAGRVNLGFASLRAGGNNADTTYSGVISGIILAGFTKEGSGRMFLTGTNTYTGKTFVNGGNLFINGQQSSAVAVNPGAFLNGDGLMGAITVTNGVLSPGNDGLFGPLMAQLNCHGVTLNENSGFWVDLAGTQAGLNYCQLNVAGAVNLGDAGLSVKLKFTSAISNQFVIVQNDSADAIVGTFKGLPEGATVNFNGAQFRISYVGGSGNDVVLTQLTLPAPPQFGGITRLGNGNIQLTGTGVPGLLYAIEANMDLNTTNWLHLGGTLAQPPTGLLQFIDVDAANYPKRFYRFILP